MPISDEALQWSSALHQAAGLLVEMRTHKGEIRAEIAQARWHLARIHELLAKMDERYEQLEEQVGLDPLTELPNRRAFDLAAAREWRSAAREARPVAVMMIDVDHFKLFKRYQRRDADTG